MRKNLLFIVSCLAILAVSCNKAGKTGLLIPVESGFVVNINMASLSSKLTWEEVKQTNWFKELNESDTDTLARQLLNNPEQSGLDVKGNHAFFASTYGRNNYTAFTGKLKDADAFAKTIQAMSKEKLTITKDGSLNFATKENDKFVLSWNSDTYLGISDNLTSGGYGEDYGTRRGLSVDSLKQLVKRLYALKGDELLDSDSRFANLLKESGDVHLWYNSATIAKASMGEMVQMMKTAVLFEGAVGTGILDFENGKISLKAKQYYGKEMTDLLKKYQPKNVSDEVLNRLPAENVIAAGAFNYPPDGLKALVTITGMDGMANGFLGEIGYSIDEFVKANKGDLAFAVSDFKMIRDSVPYDGLNSKEYYPRTRPEVKFVAGVSVNDKAAFNKLVGIITTEIGKTGKSLPVAHKLENDWFVVGSTEAEIAPFLAGKNKPAYASKISGHMGGGFLDIQRMIRIGADEMGNDPWRQRDKAALELSLKFWQDAVAYGDVKDGVVTSTFEINLVDKSTNSLKQLNKYFDELSKIRGQKDVVDTDMAVPVPDTAIAVPAN